MSDNECPCCKTNEWIYYIMDGEGNTALGCMACRAEREYARAEAARALVSALEGQLALQAISTDEADARATMQRERAEKAEAALRQLTAGGCPVGEQCHVLGLMVAERNTAEAEIARLQRPSSAPPETFRDPDLSTKIARARTEEGSNE